MVRADKRKFHYIYKITRNNSDKYYIGMHSTDNMDDGYFGSGTRLWKSINRYGKENHTMEILEFCESREQLKIREKEIIGDLWKLDEACMNLVPGGNGGWPESCHGFHSEEHKMRYVYAGNAGFLRKLTDPLFKEEFSNTLSASKKKYYEENPNVRHGVATEEIRKEMSERARSPEAVEKRKNTFKERNHQQGEKNSNFGNRSIHKDGVTIKVKSDELNEYLADGWKLGTKERSIRVNLTAEKQKIRQEQYQKLQPQCRNCGISLTFQKFVRGRTSCSKACSNSSRFKV